MDASVPAASEVLTVKIDVARSMNKLGARDRARFVVFTFQTGLVRSTVS